MSERFADPAYLAEQYGDAKRLRIRLETHVRYSENRGHFFDFLLGHLEARPDLVLLDVGCGHGAQHVRLRQQRMRIVGLDRSPGMLAEARAQAREARLDVRLCRGDAERIPLGDASVQRVMANHMLYHVPDRHAALREMRRVMAPGGRIVLGTNAADTGRRLIELHNALAAKLGYEVPSTLYDRFNLGHLSRVQEIFPAAKLKVRHDAFVFPNAPSAIRYYASALLDHVEPRPADDGHRHALLQLMVPEIQKIIDTEGVFRVPKNAGCFVAQI